MCGGGLVIFQVGLLSPSQIPGLAKKNVIKGCVSRGLYRATSDHVFLASRAHTGLQAVPPIYIGAYS